VLFRSEKKTGFLALGGIEASKLGVEVGGREECARV
jgi:hypothetical protein